MSSVKGVQYHYEILRSMGNEYDTERARNEAVIRWFLSRYTAFLVTTEDAGHDMQIKVAHPWPGGWITYMSMISGRRPGDARVSVATFAWPRTYAEAAKMLFGRGPIPVPMDVHIYAVRGADMVWLGVHHHRPGADRAGEND